MMLMHHLSFYVLFEKREETPFSLTEFNQSVDTSK